MATPINGGVNYAGKYKDKRSPSLKLRQDLRQLLNDYGVRSNPAVSNKWILSQLKKLLKRRE